MNRFAAAACLIFTCVCVHAEEMLRFSGETMGTKYSVKVFDPPEFDEDIRIAVDGVLRRVNDQMSTYLKSSEISQFNESDSTDWFEVSAEFASVVDFALQLSEKTDGAFDVTVGPLVNAWSFGPTERTLSVPDAEQLESLQEMVGYEKLSVRLEPPALKKSVAGLRVDLSAIAKGHGVDRVVELLNESGAKHVFVEIGGEVRTSGSKSGQWWKVGIQLPDAQTDDVMIAHSLSTSAGDDHSMATSGDYRNFFEADGVRYSHTIDPRTATPIDHALASVSVVTDSCMEADGWATAINVLGPNRGLEIAEAEKLDVFLISRGSDGFDLAGTGTLAQYAQAKGEAAVDAAPAEAAGNGTLATLVITFVAFATLLFLMAVGVMFGRRSIGGSCGGLANAKKDDGSVSCSLCSNPESACKELRERMSKELS
ncbi:MAG: FAD:protein FMN transferase [Rubripirellula sp.]